MRRQNLMFAFFVIAGLCTAGPVLAQEATQDMTEGTATDGMPDPKQAVFCKETYALCITAQCKKAQVPDGSGGTTTMAECECDVIENTKDDPAWSMGPSGCADRIPKQVDGKTVLVSTYSNLYNTGDNQVATCDERIDWAWCYGAECVVDPDHPNKAICNCPITESRAAILGPCDQDLCNNGLWSATWPKADCFANCHFYNQMTKHDRPTNPPATTCGGEPVCDCEGK